MLDICQLYNSVLLQSIWLLLSYRKVLLYVNKSAYIMDEFCTKTRSLKAQLCMELSFT